MPTLNNVSIKAGSTWTTYLNMIYPVGSIYIAFTSTSPATRFGGTWAKITSRFLYCTTNTDTGGSNTHTLTIDQIPSHQHKVLLSGQGSTRGALSWNGDATNGGLYGGGYVSYTGGGQSHNNMPAYQGVYCWRRTA